MSDVTARRSPIDLAGKTIVITGGGAGLGADLAELCAARGANVVLADIDGDGVEKTAAAIGARAHAVRCDVSDEASVADMAAQAVSRFGRVDGLVNNAAFTDTQRDLNLLETPLAVWDRTMSVNLRGTLLVTRAVLPAMLAGGGGSVIMVVSRQGLAPPRSARRVSYGTSKAGLIMLSRHVATAFGRDGIRCNSVAPGTIQSERMRATLSPERLAQSRANVLTPRLGEPDDVSETIAFLLSDAAEYITGQTISVDGGVLSYFHE